MLLKRVLIIVSIFLYIKGDGNYTEVIDLLRDFFKAEIRPSIIVSLVCWPKGKRKFVMFSLSRHFF